MSRFERFPSERFCMIVFLSPYFWHIQLPIRDHRGILYTCSITCQAVSCNTFFRRRTEVGNSVMRTSKSPPIPSGKGQAVRYGMLWVWSDSIPVNGSYPMNRWPIGETMWDTHHLQLNDDVGPGRYEIRAGFYYWEDGRDRGVGRRPGEFGRTARLDHGNCQRSKEF